MATCPVHSSMAGIESPAPVVSFARTAYPSTTERSNPGISPALTTSAQRTRPVAFPARDLLSGRPRGDPGSGTDCLGDRNDLQKPAHAKQPSWQCRILIPCSEQYLPISLFRDIEFFRDSPCICAGDRIGYPGVLKCLLYGLAVHMPPVRYTSLLCLLFWFAPDPRHRAK